MNSEYLTRMVQQMGASRATTSASGQGAVVQDRYKADFARENMLLALHNRPNPSTTDKGVLEIEAIRQRLGCDWDRAYFLWKKNRQENQQPEQKDSAPTDLVSM